MSSFLSHSCRSRALTAAFVLSAAALSTAAQSANFSTPTSDVMPAGEFYIEADLDMKFARLRNGGWQYFGFSTIYGIGRKAEIGLNAYSARTADGYDAVELQPNFKYQFHSNETRGTAAAAGVIAYVPLRRGPERDVFASVYVVGSKRFKSEWSPKFSAGGYKLLGASRDIGGRAGFLFAIEQPIHSRVSLIFDTNTGKNRFGYTAAGLGITVTQRSCLYTAYYFGNEGRGNNFLGVYYGVSF